MRRAIMKNKEVAGKREGKKKKKKISSEVRFVSDVIPHFSRIPDRLIFQQANAATDCNKSPVECLTAITRKHSQAHRYISSLGTFQAPGSKPALYRRRAWTNIIGGKESRAANFTIIRSGHLASQCHEAQGRAQSGFYRQ